MPCQASSMPPQRSAGDVRDDEQDLHDEEQGQGGEEEERRPLLPRKSAASAVAQVYVRQAIPAAVKTQRSLEPFGEAEWSRLCSRGLDVFKGVLVIFMTFAHVDLTLMSPALQFYSPIPHFIGNVAAGCCFLGFMLAYGFACDRAYLSDASKRRRSPAEQLERVLRSVALPLGAAWTTGFAWAFICFKFPLNASTALGILSLRLTVGNGPDFLMSFPVCLLAMFALRPILNKELGCSSLARRCLFAAAMLLAPLAMTQVVVQDCLGLRHYLGYFVECSAREMWSPNLPGLPHLFYFNLGVLLSRAAGSSSCCPPRGLLAGDPSSVALFAAGIAVVTAALAGLSYPLLTVWATNYGNVAVPTKWGPVVRGFSGGPSPLWLLGNLFGVEVLLTSSLIAYVAGERLKVPVVGSLLRFLLSELEHLGANVLLYLVVADICLAGLWRGAWGQFPLDIYGGAATTMGLLLVTRFLFYLSSTGRRPGVAAG